MDKKTDKELADELKQKNLNELYENMGLEKSPVSKSEKPKERSDYDKSIDEIMDGM